MAIGLDSVVPVVGVVEYLLKAISDHSPIQVQLRLGMVGGPLGKLWRLHPFWIQLTGYAPATELREFFLNNEGTASQACVWDTMKAFIRGIYICEISKQKTKTLEFTVAYQNRVGETEREPMWT